MENQLTGGLGAPKMVFSALTVLMIAGIAYLAVLTVSSILESKYIGRNASSQGTITVTGEGEVYSKPDLAIMNFSVISEGKNVADAMKDNSEKMKAVTEAVKKMGVEDKDLQTTVFSINPRYEYTKQVSVSDQGAAGGAAGELGISYPYPGPDYGKRVLVGYDATQSLTVKIRNLDKTAEIIQAATNAGANQTGDLQFTIDNPDELQKQAREQAIEKAKDQAKILATQLGVRLVRIMNYNENGYYPAATRMSYDAKSSAMGGAAESVPAPTIEPGQSRITSNVSITYEID